MPDSATRSLRASEPPLGADELHRLRWGLGGVLALVSVWGVFFLDLSGGALLPPVTALLVAVLGWPGLSARVPTWAWRLVFPVLILFVATDLVLNNEPLAALLRLNLLLIAVRAAGPRGTREDLQLVVLCLFLVVVSGVLTVAIGFAVLILVFTALALTQLVAITLSATTEPEVPGSEAWIRLSWRRLLGRLRRAVHWRIVAASGGLYLLVVAMATVLFLAMPRFQIENSLGFLQLKNRRALTGFSDLVKLGEVTDIAEDTTTALRAEVSDPTQVPPAPYWRLVALDAYRDGTFRASRGLARHDARHPEARELAGPGKPAGPRPVWTLYFEAGVSRYLPLAGEYARLRLAEPAALVVNDRAHTVALREERQTMFAYRLEGLEPDSESADPALAAELRAAPAGGGDDYPGTLLAVPQGPGDLATLDTILGEITGGARLEATAFAARAVGWLEQRHRYSMRSTVPGGESDVVVRWMRSAEPGHCELFAGAFTLLARRAGFATRVITGFKGGRWNAFERYFQVRNSEAHAWCEVYDELGRWRRVDPTPGASAEAAAAGRLRARATDRSWAARLDSLRMLWYRRVVNFDRGSQVEMTDRLKTASQRLGRAVATRLDQWGRAVQEWALRPWNTRRAGQWGGVTALTVIVCWGLWRTRALWWWRWKRRSRGDPVRREASRWLRRLRGGVRTDASARTVAQLERLRFGSVEGRPAPMAVFRAARREWRNARRGGRVWRP